MDERCDVPVDWAVEDLRRQYLAVLRFRVWTIVAACIVAMVIGWMARARYSEKHRGDGALKGVQFFQ